jgi:hypothetical protein
MIVSKDYDPIEGGIRPFAIWQERLGIGHKCQNKIWDLTVMLSDQD